MAHSRSSDGTANDGRALKSMLNSAATGSNWLGAALYIGLAGALYEHHADAVLYVIGGVAGCVLAASLLAPSLRKFGRYTVPDFLGARYGGSLARFIGGLILLTVLFVFMTAHIYGVGLVASWQLGIDFGTTVFIGLATILVCFLLSAIRTARYLPLALCFVALIAFLLLLFAAADFPMVTHFPFEAYVAELFLPGWSIKRTTEGTINLAAGIACIAIGLAALPQIRMRYLTAPSARQTRLAAAWDVLVILLIASAAPAHAVVMHFAMTDNATDGDMFTLAAFDLAGLSPVFSALVAAGALCLLLLTGTRALRALAQTLGGSGRLVDGTPENKRSPRWPIVLAIALAIAATYAAGQRPASILTMVAWAMSLAASGLFPAIALGVWWKRTTTIGACCGMVAGSGICIFYIAGTQFFPNRFIDPFGNVPITPAGVGWWGIDNVAAGLFGIPVALAVTVLVSLVTPAPGPEMQEFVASLRRRRTAIGDGQRIE